MSTTKKVYVVAVSGGVDSVALLHKLVEAGQAELVVAHFDHGIRLDSRQDCEFVQQLAKRYGLSFEYAEGKLGADASEAKARQARYQFLANVKKKYKADAVVTAHHQDDVIETAIINILRGTRRRGLASLNSKPDLLRPLLDLSKFMIVKYAVQNNLKWREDPSNEDTKYLRNYVRLVLIPQLDRADPDWKDKFIRQIERGGRLNQAISQQLERFGQNEAGGWMIERQAFIGLPREIGMEILRHQLSSASRIDKTKLKKAWLFAKTAKSGSSLGLSNNEQLKIDGANVLITAKVTA